MAQQRIIAFLLIVLVCGAYAEDATPLTLPKLPLYIGKGYNVLLGNPLSSEGVDPGFEH